MASKTSDGAGTREDPWILRTPPGKSEYQAYRDETADPAAVVVIVGSTELRYRLSCITDLRSMLGTTACAPSDRSVKRVRR
jgi:hypothetical protein